MSGVDQQLQTVRGAEQNIGNRRRDGEMPVPQLVEQRFHLMSELPDRSEPEHAAVPFDGMRRAKNAVQQVQVFRMLLELQETIFNRREMLGRFFEK